MWVNSNEKNAEQNGYRVFSAYNTKEEADAVMKAMREDKLRCFKAHHKNQEIGLDKWVVWVKGLD